MLGFNPERKRHASFS